MTGFVLQPTIYALWRSFTQCTFIEGEGDIVFFKNQRGEAIREYVEPKTGAEPDVEVEEREDDALKLAGL